MAEKKKTSAGGKRSASPAKRGSAKKKNTKRPIRREVGGLVMLLIALCVGVSYFSKEDAILINLLSVGLKGLVGYGYWLMLPAFLAASYVLLLHRGRPVKLGVTGAMMAPVFASSLWHLIFCKQDFPSALGVLPRLWESGGALKSGGVLGGILAIAMDAVLGQAASLIIFGVLLMASVMAALRMSPGELKRRWEERERLEYEVEEEPAPRAAKAISHELPAAGKRQAKPVPLSPIDIPLEETEPAVEILPKAEEKKGLLGGLFRERPDHIKTPGELLTGETPVAEEPKKEEKPSVRESIFPIREPLKPLDKQEEKPAEPVLEPEAEKFVKKAVSATEAANEAAQVTKEIEEKRAEEKKENGAAYQFPPVTLLRQGSGNASSGADAELQANARRLAETLRSFGVDAAPGEVVRGPSVTRYEFILEQGVKLSKVTNLADDIALALGTSGVRIAPIPNKISVVGLEVPNKQVAMVTIRDIIESKAFADHSSLV